ncbi:membrane-associated oxidoreductase [Actinoplanes sichuanensis]|uniref:Membrane-associated oxidoreductase n=1 Tax=Actinoplanes sichuanensis TaxID=512349 RepID=A0ABW4AS93_9ACTN|nr:hypothetical protein [Actinoplanes sichuanensis]BEL04969.1 membrane-associated oxidoreductase [Actinoplanes sichuanensis]
MTDLRTRRRVRRAFRDGVPLDLGGAAVDGELLARLLRDGGGRLNLSGAHVTGSVDLTGARIDMPLRLRGCVFDEPLLLDHADLVQVNLDGCTLPGIEADGLRVAGDLGVRDATVTGDVWLLPARIGGSVELDGSRIGGGVHLQRAEIGGGVHLRGTTVGLGLRLTGARVTGSVDLRAARIGPDPDTGAAISAGSLVVGGSLFAHEVIAGGEIHLVGVQVGGSLTMRDTVLSAPGGGYSLLLIEAQARLLTLRPAPESTGTISLRDARFGRLADDPVRWPAGCEVELDGLTYDRLARRSEDVVEWTARQRLAWMARYTSGYAPGPYDQLAAALARDGREQEARQVRVVRERRRYRAMGWAGAVWGAVQEAGIGFGYRPGRALTWLLAVVAASTAWFAWSGPLRAVKPDEAPTWDPFLYSVDLLVPLLDLGHDKVWDPVGADKAVALAVMVAGWVLATTVITGAGRTLGR